jgi:hypothetical protein
MQEPVAQAKIVVIFILVEIQGLRLYGVKEYTFMLHPIKYYVLTFVKLLIIHLKFIHLATNTSFQSPSTLHFQFFV